MERDRAVYPLLILGVLGIVIGFIPVYYANGCPVTFLDYCQSGVPVYVDVFEKLRFYYLPMLMISITMVVVSIPTIIRPDKYKMPLDVKFMLALGYTIANLPLIINGLIEPGLLSYSMSSESIVISASIKIEGTLLYKLLVGSGVYPLFNASIATLGGYLAEIVFTIFHEA